MKLLSCISLVAVVAMLVAIPAVAQVPAPTPAPIGIFISWNINLHSITPIGGEGTAQYFVAKPTLRKDPTPGGNLTVHTKFVVECEYLKFADATPLSVYIGPGLTAGEPYGKLIGTMQVVGGSATLLTARPPVVNKGATVTIVHEGTIIMKGTF